MAVTTKKLFSATTNATTTVFSPVGIQLNNQDDLDVYVTLSGGTRVLQLRQSTGSTADSTHPQVNNTDGLYFPAVTAGTTLYNYTLSTDNNTITFNSALPQGAVVFCERRTRDADSSYTTFASGSTIRATDLNNSSTESNFTAQDGRNKALTIEGVLFRGDQPSTNFITSDHIVAGTIVENDISDNSVTANKIPDDTINSQHYVAGSIDLEHMSANSVDSDQYVDGSIEHVHLANDIIDGDNIQDDVINSEHYVAGSIDTEHIANDQVTYEKIQDVSATNRVLGRDSSGAGVIEEITPSALRTMINVEDGATADQTNAEIKTAYEANANTNEFSDAEQTKLAGIETGATADQTNAEIKTAYEANANTNEFTDAEKTKLGNLGSLNSLSDVNTSGVADGKILKYDASASEFIIADDGGGGSGGGSSTFTGLSDTPANYGSAANKTLKINSAGNAVEFVDVTTSFTDLTDTPSSLSGQGGKAVKVNSGGTALEFAAADVVDDTTPQLGGNLDVQANEITTSTTNGNIKVTPNGTGVVEVKGAGGNDGTLQLNCSANSHGVKIKSPPHSASQNYTLTLPSALPSDDGFLVSDSNGNTSFTTEVGLIGNELRVHDLYLAQDSSNVNPVIQPSAQASITLRTSSTQSGTFGSILDSSGLQLGRNTQYVKLVAPADQTGQTSYTFTFPPTAGSNGQALTTNGSGTASWTSINTDLVNDTSPQLGGELDSNNFDIKLTDGEKLKLYNYGELKTKTGATNAVVSGLTGYVLQNSTVLDSSSYDLWFRSSGGKKITFGTSDSLTHEVMRVQCAAVGASQHGFVNLNYVTANAGGNASSSTKLQTTSTGITVTGTVAATAYTGDGSGLSGVDPTVANGCIYENNKTITSNFTTSTTKNSMSAGPITVDTGVTLTIPSGSTYTIV